MGAVCVWYLDTYTKAESLWLAGEDRRGAALATSGPKKVQEDANALPLSTLWRSEIARGHGWSGATVHSDYATTMMMMMLACGCDAV